MTARKAKAVAKQEKPSAKDVAKITILPSVNAAAVIQEYGKPFGEQDINALIDELRSKMGAVHDGDMGHCESMLLGQATALQTIFVNLARRAVNQDYLNQYETYLRLALRAQNQSRMTLETLAAIKNPPVVFARQANINQGSGNQQVNNGAAVPDNRSGTHARTRAGETINPQNELLTEDGADGATLDAGRTGTAIPTDSGMEAVGVLHRS